jgi:hypothetical protein
MSRKRPVTDSTLGLELERLALRAVQRTYEDLNGSLFRFRLSPPAFELTQAESRLGRWVEPTRTIELARRLLLDETWGVLVEVLKHEMAHQFVSEVLGVRDEAQHGPLFRKVCAERGIDARAAGIPEPGAARHRDIERVAKLLALAQSSNEHEAQAAAVAAQRLMLKYNIDSVLRGERAHYRFRHLGEPTGRVPEYQRILAAILGSHFFVQVIWVPVYRPLVGKRGSVLEVVGTDENLELADYVYAFLTQTAERLFARYQSSEGLRSRKSRQSYLSGVMSGFREKLDRERATSNEQGLVWQGDGELAKYFRSRHPHIRFRRHAARTGGKAYAEGRRAGKSLVLHRGVQAGASDAAPRLLGGRK